MRTKNGTLAAPSADGTPDEAFGSVGFRVVCDIALPANEKRR
jgi:hypothetical protein